MPSNVYRLVMFDLDGTLIDSYDSLCRSLKDTLIYFDIELPPDEELYGLIGPRTYDTFRNRFGKTHEESMAITEWHRDNYAKNHLFEVTPCKGIMDVLDAIRDKGIITTVITNKRQDLAVSILDHLNMSSLFDGIYGSNVENSILKYQSMERCLSEFDIDKKEAVSVGDTPSDQEAAKTSGVDFIPVSYGYSRWGGIKSCKDTNELLVLLNKP